MALSGPQWPSSCTVLCTSQPHAKLRKIWGSFAQVEITTKAFCQRLVNSCPPQLCVLYTEDESVVEFARLVLANGPYVLCVCSSVEFCNLFKAEVDRSASFVLVPDPDPQVIPDDVKKALELLIFEPESIALLISEDRYLYQPVNEMPRVPLYPLAPPEIQQHFSTLSLSSWSFNVHECTDLLGCICHIIEAVLALPGLEAFRLPQAELWWFLSVMRACYRSNVKYHNFHHVCDVVQASFSLLFRPFGVLMVTSEGLVLKEDNKLGFGPKDVLATILAALGHDMLHPGLSSPVFVYASHYFSARFNCLEEYHRTFYIAILRQLWPSVVNDAFIATMIQEQIMATDLSAHSRLSLCESAHLHIIKVADISNGARSSTSFKEKCAKDIFHEFQMSSTVAHLLGFSLFPRVALLSSQTNDSELKEVQRRFLHGFLKPYLDILEGKYGGFDFLYKQCIIGSDFWND